MYFKQKQLLQKQKQRERHADSIVNEEKGSPNDKKKFHEREPLIDESVRVKICDLDDVGLISTLLQRIQTRQYRGPEVMLGIECR
jgi:hypothetical protein